MSLPPPSTDTVQAVSSALVTPAWLAARLDDPSLRIVDATYTMPAWNRDAAAEFRAAHIPGAVFFDIDLISATPRDRNDGAPDGPLPHMVPSPEGFAALVGALGIGNAHTVVAYDTAGLFSAARAWWMFRLFGHTAVHVLDGGLPRWRAEGHAVSDAAITPSPATFIPTLRPDLLATVDQMAATDPQSIQIVDARGGDRFRGEVDDSWPGRRRGHIPGSRNLPFTDLLTEGKTLLPPRELADRFRAAGVDPARPIVTTCGSGITACVIALALHEVGASETPVYDGSWAEWGLRADLPNEITPR